MDATNLRVMVAHLAPVRAHSRIAVVVVLLLSIPHLHDVLYRHVTVVGPPHRRKSHQVLANVVTFATSNSNEAIELEELILTRSSLCILSTVNMVHLLPLLTPRLAITMDYKDISAREKTEYRVLQGLRTVFLIQSSTIHAMISRQPLLTNILS